MDPNEPRLPAPPDGRSGQDCSPNISQWCYTSDLFGKFDERRR